MDGITFMVMAPFTQTLTSSKQYSKYLYGKSDRNKKKLQFTEKIMGKIRVYSVVINSRILFRTLRAAIHVLLARQQFRVTQRRIILQRTSLGIALPPQTLNFVRHINL